MTADHFLERVLGDEGWQSGLASDTVEAIVHALEARFPPEATVADAEGEAIRATLRKLGDDVRAIPAAEADLLAAWLAGAGG
jgi:hypothetical protein